MVVLLATLLLLVDDEDFRNKKSDFGMFFVVGTSAATEAFIHTASTAKMTTTNSKIAIRELVTIPPKEHNHCFGMISRPKRRQTDNPLFVSSGGRDGGLRRPYDDHLHHRHRHRHRHHFFLLATNTNENNDEEELEETISTIFTQEGDDTRKGYDENSSAAEFDDENSSDDVSLPSLDIVLENARRRRSAAPSMMVLVYQIQAFFDGPFIIIPVPSPSSSSSSTSSKTVVTFKRFDALLIILSAMILQVPGFALGWIVGKLTLNLVLLNEEFFLPVPKPPAPVVILIQPFWPFLWAVLFDQIV